MPDAKDVHIDAALSEFAMRYSNLPAGYIAEAVAPRVGVNKQSDYYYVWDKNNLRRVDDLRKEKTEPNKIDYTVSSDTYFCNDHELATLVSDEERDNADPAISPEEDAVTFLLDTMSLNREYRVASILTSTSLITNNRTLATTDQWSDYTNSDPFAHIRVAITTCRKACLRRPNLFLYGAEVGEVLAQHPDYIDRYKNVREGLEPVTLVPTIMGCRTLEAGAMEVTSQEGQATEVIAELWGKHVVIGYVPGGKPTKTTPAGLVTMEWKGRQVRRGREEKKKSDWIAASDGYTDVKLTGGCFFYLLKNAIA